MDDRKQQHTAFARPLVDKTHPPAAPPPDRQAVRRAFEAIVRRRGAGGTLDRSLAAVPARVAHRGQPAARLLDHEAVRRVLDAAVRRRGERETSAPNRGAGGTQGSGHELPHAQPGASPARRRRRRPKAPPE